MAREGEGGEARHGGEEGGVSGGRARGERNHGALVVRGTLIAILVVARREAVRRAAERSFGRRSAEAEAEAEGSAWTGGPGGRSSQGGRRVTWERGGAKRGAWRESIGGGGAWGNGGGGGWCALGRRKRGSAVSGRTH